MKIIIDNNIFDVKLENNSTAKAFYNMLPVTLKMKEFKELKCKKDIPTLNRDIEEDIEADDEEIELLEKLLAQKKARKRDKDLALHLKIIDK